MKIKQSYRHLFIFFCFIYLTFSLNSLYKFYADEELTDELATNLEQIDSLYVEIEANTFKQEQIEKEIEPLNSEIDELEADLASKQTEVDKQKNELAKYLTFLQKTSRVTTRLEIIYDAAQNETNSYSNLYSLNIIEEEISQEMNNLSNQLSSYVTKQNELDRQKADLVKEQEELQQIEKDLSEDLEEAEEKTDQIKEELAQTNRNNINYDSSANITDEKETLMSNSGISEDDYQYVDYIIDHESSWNYTATNPTSGAYGLCQALPGWKMNSAGADWQTNPQTQMDWCNSYAIERYGSWENAYNFWIENNWW